MLCYTQKGCKNTLPSGEAGKWRQQNAPGFLHLRVWLDGFTAFSSTVRRHPRHPISLTKQRFHVLMATESETHGLNFLQDTQGYQNQCRKAIWLTTLGAFLSPEMVRNCGRWLLSPEIPPGSALPEHSPGLMWCEAPAVLLERGRCLPCGTFTAAISAEFLLSAVHSFAQLLPPQSRQGDLTLAADRDPCLKVDRGWAICRNNAFQTY